MGVNLLVFAAELQKVCTTYIPREKGETRTTPRLAFLAWDDFPSRSRLARFNTIPEEKRGLLVI